MVTTSEFLSSLDIANRACFHCGVRKINSVTEESRQNEIFSELYGKLRQAELRRNVWRFSKRRSILRPITATTRLIEPHLWDKDNVYLPYAIVKDANGYVWTSNLADNMGNEPGSSSAWERYYGPATVDLYDEDTTYYAGELVYVEGDYPGGFIIMRSLVNNNEDDPVDTTDWDASAVYGIGDRVWYDDSTWHSLIPYNTGITPADAPADWASDVTYDTDDPVVAGDGYIYTSVGDTNLGNDPLKDDGTLWTHTGVPAAWARTSPELRFSASTWHPIFSNMKNVGIEHLSLTTRQGGGHNVFHVPIGWLRTARKNGRWVEYPNDHEALGRFITSSDAIIELEYAADITDVRLMDPMFCEGLAARLAFEAVELLTQSRGKKQDIARTYTQWMTEARLVNGIEIGPEAPDEDEFILVRR